MLCSAAKRPRNGERSPTRCLRPRNISRRNSQLPRRLIPLPLEFDRKDVEQVEHFPSQQEHRDQHNHDCHQLAKTQAAAIRFKALGRKAQNVQRRKTEYHCPENVIDVAARAAILQRHQNAKKRCLASNERIESHCGTTRPCDTRDQRTGNREHDGRVKVARKGLSAAQAETWILTFFPFPVTAQRDVLAPLARPVAQSTRAVSMDSWLPNASFSLMSAIPCSSPIESGFSNRSTTAGRSPLTNSGYWWSARPSPSSTRSYKPAQESTTDFGGASTPTCWRALA